LASLVTAAGQSVATFTSAAKAAMTPGGATAIALVGRRGAGWVVTAAPPNTLAVGTKITGPRLRLVASAGTTLRTDLLSLPDGQSRLAIALRLAGASPEVVYEEFAVDPTRPTPITQSQPFHELDVALYVGAQADPAKLLLSTTPNLPLHGTVATSPVTIGASTWLVVANAREPLAGTLASNVPRILTLVAVLIGAAMTIVVEIVGRRRDYAVSLVDERTTELQDSLRRLEDTQQALVSNERLAALGQMAATVGHELRNPLGVLTNSLYLIRNATSTGADDRLRRQLDTADREIAAATLIVSDLLEFSRPRAANPTAVNVTDLLIETVSVAPPPAGITVEYDDSEVPTVMADRDQIRQVILNLLTNAYEAMPTGGTVRLAARVVKDSVEIAVSDTGVGMDEQTYARVFEPFFSSKTKGTGLGLAVSKRIVDKHDGTLTMTSEPGHGCTAMLRLPLSPAPVAVGR
jgi:signal transduction histidine kinase